MPNIIGGPSLVFDASEPLPLRGFPAGKTRIIIRPESFPRVFVRPPEGGVRCFYITEKDGCWMPFVEAGRNMVVNQ